MHRRVYYDTEFYEDGDRIHLISLGAVDSYGNTFYRENADFDWLTVPKHHWIQDNVRPYLMGDFLETREQIAKDFAKWTEGRVHRNFGAAGDGLWGYYSAYDHVALCQLYGIMVDLPSHIPMFTHDLRSLADIGGVHDIRKHVPLTGTEHNALDDALWTKKATEWLDDMIMMGDFG